MTTPALTIGAVRAWRTEVLDLAAETIGRAHTSVDDELNAARKAVDTATATWRGTAGDAAFERMQRDLADAMAVRDALERARLLLAQGASSLGAAQAELCVLVDAAVAQGFVVADDGGVSAPALPPVMSSVTGAPQAAMDREARQSELVCAAGGIAPGIAHALLAAADADHLTADALRRIELPLSMRAQVDALLQPPPADSGLGWLIGAFGFGQGVARSVSAGLKTRAYVQWLNGSLNAAEVFAVGAANGGHLRFLMGSPAARLVGRAFLPLTMLSGANDALAELSGEGYGGARGATTAVLGGSAAVGAGAMLAGGSLFLASNPVGWTIAAGAVLAYTGWSAGNLIYDHREAIGGFVTGAAEWTGNAAVAVADVSVDAVAGATEWAGDRAGGLLDAGRDLLDVPRPSWLGG